MRQPKNQSQSLLPLLKFSQEHKALRKIYAEDPGQTHTGFMVSVNLLDFWSVDQCWLAVLGSSSSLSTWGFTCLQRIANSWSSLHSHYSIFTSVIIPWRFYLTLKSSSWSQCFFHYFPPHPNSSLLVPFHLPQVHLWNLFFFSFPDKSLCLPHTALKRSLLISLSVSVDWILVTFYSTGNVHCEYSPCLSFKVWITSHTQDNFFQFHAFASKFHGFIFFLIVNMPCYFYPLFGRETSRLFSFSGCYE